MKMKKYAAVIDVSQVNNLVTLKMTFFALELFSGSDHENHSIKSGPFVCQESLSSEKVRRKF